MQAKAYDDRAIRAALHREELSLLHACPDTIVIDELGLSHAKVRVDIAIINDRLHGYEIKSDVDSLSRLSMQLSIYEQCLEKLTIVCAERHIRAVKKISPKWCGILKATVDTQGAIKFTLLRQAALNPKVQAEKVAHLLWRSEAAELLERMNAPKELLKKPRGELYRYLAKTFTVQEITNYVREFMACRREWRGLPARA